MPHSSYLGWFMFHLISDLVEVVQLFTTGFKIITGGGLNITKIMCITTIFNIK